MEQVLHEISHGYDQWIIEPGKQAELFLLISFLTTFGFIRTSVHLIKRGVSWWPGNVETKGGLHIHHMVWGILLMICVGFTVISLEPGSPWHEILAVSFGVGMGLTLDEFALWLNLDDVYWAPKGRESVDAVIVAAALIGIVMLGLRFWIDFGQALVLAVTGLGDASGEDTKNAVIFIACQATGLACAAVTFLKHKIFVGIFGVFIPLIAFIGAVRLAKPHSRWARRFYGEAKLGQAKKRFKEEPSGGTRS